MIGNEAANAVIRKAMFFDELCSALSALVKEFEVWTLTEDEEKVINSAKEVLVKAEEASK